MAINNALETINSGVAIPANMAYSFTDTAMICSGDVCDAVFSVSAAILSSNGWGNLTMLELKNCKTLASITIIILLAVSLCGCNAGTLMTATSPQNVRTQNI